MALGNRSLTVFSAAVFCFVTALSTPSQAILEKPWYSKAFSRMLRAVNYDGKTDAGAKEADNSYVSRVAKEESTITLKGQIPSEGDLKVLQGVVAATSPGANIVYKTRINANVPNRDTWLAGMTFALRQLAKLENGNALLKDNSIYIEGVTKADDNFAVLKQKIAEEAPNGLVLQPLGLRPPAVHPFIWAAQLKSGNLSLSGHVPNESDQPLFRYAQNLFHDAQVNNAMASAAGAPANWITAAELSLDMLTLLQHGSVTLRDNVIQLNGVFSSPGMVELLKAYSKRLPAGFKLETHVVEESLASPAMRPEEVSVAARSTPAPLNP